MTKTRLDGRASDPPRSKRAAKLLARAETDRRERRFRTTLWMAALAALVMVVFGQVVFHDFVHWDDVGAIVHNPDFDPPVLGNLGHYWSSWRTGYRNFYAPVLYTTWGLVAQLASRPTPTDLLGPTYLEPALFHLASLLTHLMAVWLLFALLRRWSGSEPAAFCGAAVFAIHPIQTEAVAWASTLYTPLSVMLALAAACQFTAFADRLSDRPATDIDPAASKHLFRRAALHYGVATTLYIAALLTKPSVILLPVLLGLAEWLVAGRDRRALGRTLLALLPWLLLSLLSTWQTTQLTQTATTVFRPSVLQRVLIAADTFAFQVRHILWPFGYMPDYGRTPQWSLNAAHLWLWAGFCSAIGVLAVTSFRRAPWATLAILWGVGGTAATLGLVPFDYQIFSTVADRYFYFSMVGVAIAVTFVAARFGSSANRWPTRRTGLARVIFAAWLLLLGVRAAWQASLWTDTRTLFAHELALNPTSRAGLSAFLTLLDQEHDYTQAILYGQRGMELHPDDLRIRQYTAHVQMELGEPRNAAETLRPVPDMASTPEERFDAVNMLGAALARDGQLAAAEAQFRTALQMRPGDVRLRQNLGHLMLDQGRPAEALAIFRALLDEGQDSPALRQAISQAESAAGRLSPPDTGSPSKPVKDPHVP